MGSLMNLNPIVPVELFDLGKQSIEFATGSYILSKHYSTLLSNITLLNILYRRLYITDEDLTLDEYEYAHFVKISTNNPNQPIIREMLMWSQGITNGIASTYLENVHLYLLNEENVILEAYIINIKYNLFELPPEHYPTPDEVKEATKGLLWNVAGLQYWPKLNVNVNIRVELGFTSIVALPNCQPVGLELGNETALSGRIISAIRHDFSVICTGYHMITVSYLTNVQVPK